MASLLHCLLIALRSLTVLHILLQPLPSLTQSTQIPGQNESNGEVNLNIRDSKLVAEQEFSGALLQLRSHEVQVILDVLRQPDFCLLNASRLLMPARVQNRDSVQSERAFRCVNPLQDCVSFRVAEGWEKAVGGIVGVT